MKNITLAIGEDVLDKVRSYAVERKTTVNAIVRQHLEKIANENDLRAEALRQLKRLSETTTATLGPGYKWNREDLYDRPVFHRHQRSDLRGDGDE